MGMEPTSLLRLTQPRDFGCTGNPDTGAEIGHMHDDKQQGKIGHVAIQRFGLRCQAFYNSSLLITNSSSFLDQDKNVGYAMSDDAAHVNERKVFHGKIVVEALDRIGAMRAILQHYHVSGSAEIWDTAQKSMAKLRQEHDMAAECYRDLLNECGLLDIDRFIRLERSPFSVEQGATIVYQQYVQMRDAIRRRSHKFAMFQRQSSLLQFLSESEEAQSSGESVSCDRSTSLTKICYIKLVISTMEEFVRKYSPNIGSHSFLAGLHRFIQLQLHPSDKSKSSSDPAYVVQWNFLGSVLTEACHSHGKSDTQAYARDATKVLFSFLTWIKTKDVEIGDFSLLNDNLDDSLHPLVDIKEILLSFQINKYVSNATLRRILSVLPNPKVLDARATGSVEVIDIESASNKSKGIMQASRMNADGHMDEAWPWFPSWQFCSVL
ncbi:hypothetical protein HJC23_002702 [Cyclotella cryptica]|uniref:Uncharacterized protein n=1 Tax=Cyclotella cryptica TaxID=29204 RepID=A0ABD3PB70_9STRA|eukprot:CCRYP_016031-RA/>CCRYP_016031-RA protein AED:0.00 eAED:0.00 QI:167/-1/1/1/-1/1/1/57/434